LDASNEIEEYVRLIPLCNGYIVSNYPLLTPEYLDVSTHAGIKLVIGSE
jgi:hypothetical protein